MTGLGCWSGPSTLPGPPERVTVVSTLPWLSLTVRLSSTVWQKKKKKKKKKKEDFTDDINNASLLCQIVYKRSYSTNSANTFRMVSQVRLFSQILPGFLSCSAHSAKPRHFTRRSAVTVKKQTIPLTPSGCTTLVTVTDWKNDRVLGWFGDWPVGGVRIWSRPLEDTAESRSKKDRNG